MGEAVTPLRTVSRQKVSCVADDIRTEMGLLVCQQGKHVFQSRLHGLNAGDRDAPLDEFHSHRFRCPFTRCDDDLRPVAVEARLGNARQATQYLHRLKQR